MRRYPLLLLAGWMLSSCCGGAISPIGTVGGSLAIQGRDVPGGNGCWTDKDGTTLLLDDPLWDWGSVRFDGDGLVGVAPIKGAELSADGNLGFLDVGTQPCATVQGDKVTFDCEGEAQNLYWVLDRPAEESDVVVITVEGTLQFVGCGSTRPW